MPKESKARDAKRKRRPDPIRSSPIRNAAHHMRHNATSRNDPGGGQADSVISETIQKAITDVVNLGFTVIEQQIREGQRAADRLREDVTTSRELNADVTKVVESLVATTKDVGAAWLDVMSIVLRSVAPQSGPTSECAETPGNAANSSQAGTARATTITTTWTGASGGATTISSITPADPAGPRVPIAIVVKGNRAKQVMLDLRPPSGAFAPFAQPLPGTDPKHSLTVKFGLGGGNKPVLTVDIPARLPAGTYTGAVVDSSTNRAGGTVSVTIGE